MLITEIITKNIENYHKLDITGTKFNYTYKLIQDCLSEINRSDFDTYTQWISYLNSIDIFIHQFILDSKNIMVLINYFENFNRQYISKGDILKMVKTIVEMRKSING